MLGLFVGLSKNETLLSTPGEVYDLVELKTKSNRKNDDDI